MENPSFIEEILLYGCFDILLQIYCGYEVKKIVVSTNCSDGMI